MSLIDSAGPSEISVVRVIKNTKVNVGERISRYKQIMQDGDIDVDVVSLERPCPMAAPASWLLFQARKLAFTHPLMLTMAASITASMMIP